MEQISIIGNIGRAEKKEFGGKEFIEFSMACNYKKKDGTAITTWYRVNTSQTQLLPYLDKGRQMYVQGRPVFSAYADKTSGAPVPSITILADRVEFCGKKEEGVQQQQYAPSHQQPYSPQQRRQMDALNSQFGAVPVQQQSFAGFPHDDNNDLPF